MDFRPYEMIFTQPNNMTSTYQKTIITDVILKFLKKRS